MRRLRLLCLLGLAVSGTVAAQTTTVPFTFTPGTAAKATEVNADFQALVTAINNLNTRVGKLEGTQAPVDADVVGTYRVSILQVGIARVTSDARPGMDAVSYEGTWTVAANHTFTATYTGHQNDDSGPHPDDGAVSGSWALSNGDVTFTVPGSTVSPVHCLAGCRLMIGTSYRSAAAVNTEGQNLILVLTRFN